MNFLGQGFQKLEHYDRQTHRQGKNRAIENITYYILPRGIRVW